MVRRMWSGVCQVLGNGQGYVVMGMCKHWELVKGILGWYFWRDIQCMVNPEEIQGYICER